MALEKIVKNSSGVPTGEYERIAGGTLYADSPIGTILPYGGATAPTGWFICQGQAISRTNYAELFAVIGTAFGAGDGSTTFNLPDMRESVPKGAGLTGKTVVNHLDADGLAVGEFLDDRIQDHIHRFSSDNSNVGTANCAREGGAVSQNRITPDSEVINARSGATTEVKSVGVNYIIKAKMVALPADFLAKVDEAVGETLEGVTLLESELTDTQVTVSLSESVANYQYITIEIYGPGIIRGSTFTKAVAGREYLVPFTYSGELVIGEIQIQNVGTTAKVKYSFSGSGTVSNVGIRVIGIVKKS